MDDLQKALVKAVRDYARANYEMDGWDYIVEAFEDKDILEALGGARTAKGAIRNVGQVAKLYNERRSEAQSYNF